MTDVTILPTQPKWPRVLLPLEPEGPVAASARRTGRSTAPALPPTHAALRAAVETLHPEGVLDLVEESGLRGRGTSPGLPTGAKWRACAAAPADHRYVVVNAWQSDPAVLTDRVLVERNAAAVLAEAPLHLKAGAAFLTLILIDWHLNLL